MRVSWIQNGSEYRRLEGEVSNIDTITPGIYNIGLSMTGWYLERTADNFSFDYKVYGLQNEFVQHVLHAYKNTTGNLGILLNGIKGTGKTVTAKTLANQFKLPIIIVKSFGENNQNMIEFLASFNFDCVFFFDEFEKNFSDKDSSILQIMDGVYTSVYRRIFLLTTNETCINDNLISRPSRLRYIHEFGNLEQEVAREYLKDNLNNKEYIEDIVDFVDTLQISTIDILKSIVEEINIFGYERFIETKSFFNVKTASYTYRCIRCYLRGEKELREYSADKFITEIKMFGKKPTIYDFPEDSAYKKAVDEYYSIVRHDPCYKTLYNIQKPFKSIKIGDNIGYYGSERVVAVDIPKKIFITKDYDDGDFYYYFIENPDQKPSLNNESLTNPYFGLL